MKIEKKSINLIIPYINNARKHDEKQLKKIAASINEFGFNNPILIDKNNVVIAGHGRLDAAKLLGLEEVPVICIDHLTEAQKKAFILADNRIAQDASWDSAILINELELLKEMDFDIELTGFSDKDLGINDLQEEEEKNISDKTEYIIIVNCSYEKEQENLYQELTGRGFDCKLMM